MCICAYRMFLGSDTGKSNGSVCAVCGKTQRWWFDWRFAWNCVFQKLWNDGSNSAGSSDLDCLCGIAHGAILFQRGIQRRTQSIWICPGRCGTQKDQSTGTQPDQRGTENCPERTQGGRTGESPYEPEGDRGISGYKDSAGVSRGGKRRVKRTCAGCWTAASEKKYKARKSTSSGNSGYTVAGVVRYYSDAVWWFLGTASAAGDTYVRRGSILSGGNVDAACAVWDRNKRKPKYRISCYDNGTGAWCERSDGRWSKKESSSHRSAEAVRWAGRTGNCRCPGGDCRACRCGGEKICLSGDTAAAKRGSEHDRWFQTAFAGDVSKITDDVDKFRCQCQSDQCHLWTDGHPVWDSAGDGGKSK